MIVIGDSIDPSTPALGTLAVRPVRDEERAVLMDDKGRAYHISNINLDGAHLTRLEQPRSALNELMDAYNVQDGPNWSQVRD